jgi:hypothetical protein
LNNYPFLSYRIGLCSLEVELNNLRTESSSNYNEVIEKLLGYREEAKEKTNGVGLSLSNLPLSPINNKYTDADTGNNTNSRNESQTFNFGSVPDINVKRFILRNNSKQEGPFGKISSKYLTEAVKYFKETILILKDNVYLKKEIDEVLKIYSDATNTSYGNNLEHPSEIKSHQQIMTSSYLNLIFALILSEEWNEVLFFCEEFEKSPNFSRESEYIVDNYKMEAYLTLNQHKNILDILKKNMQNNAFSYSSLESRGSFYNKVNKLLYPELNYKIALYINIIKMNFITNNLPEAEKGILSILNLMNVNFSMNNGVLTHGDLPPFILNLIVYYLIVKENFEAAIAVLKRRRVPPFLAQNIFQPAGAVGVTPGAKLPFNMK